MSKNVTPIFEANMDAALRSHYRRTQAGAIDTRMPFDRMVSFEDALRLEDDGIENEGGAGIGDYEMQQRVIGVRAFIRYLKARSLTMPQIMRQLFAAGRAVQDEFFSSLTMTESGLMFSETKSAHSWRCKVISGEIKLEGMKGVRLPGQKTPESSASYAASATGNTNRKGGKRQSSFLRKLDVKPDRGNRKPDRQRTFTRQLSGNGATGPHKTNSAPRSIPTSGGSPRAGASRISKAVA